MMPVCGAHKGLCSEVQQAGLVRKRLGRFPCLSLRTMIDCGLSDQEIGQYFQVTPASVRRLRRVFAGGEAGRKWSFG